MKRLKLGRKLTSTVAAALTLSLLAGCGGAGGESTAETAAPAEGETTASAEGGSDYSGKTLNLLTWEGYADDSFVKPFEEKTGCKVNATYFTTSDDLAAKLKAGGGDTYDIISPSGDMAGYIVENDMAEPIDTSKLTYWNDISDSVKLSDVEKDGQIYGVPYLWGPDYLIYDADVVTEEPTSWNVFWDEKYAGRISLYDDISNIYMIGQIDGLDKDDKSAIYNMSDEQLNDAKERLSKINSSVRKYWVSAGELNDLFANKEVDIAVGWPITVKELNDQGRNLKWTIPEEGCTGWMDRLMIVKGSKNPDLAMEWLNYVTSPEGQALSSAATYYTIVNKNALEFMDEDLISATNSDSLDEFFAKINFWQYVENRDKYNDIWTQVKTAG